MRFSGKIGVDMHYSNKSAYTNVYKQKLIKKSEKIKILIATHCFFDSPHSYGKNIFPDFYEWLDYLGKISNKTDYDWYIKLHPNYHPLTMNVINHFLKKHHGGRVYFPFQKVILPIIPLAILSTVFYFITKQ